FLPLEDLRNSIHPVRVLHEAIELTKIAHSGPHLPLLSQLNDTERATVGEAARTLLHLHLP
ncbi:MAG: dihydrodipicolinate synthase family protein, partial [Roseibacillus sp.]|nr:dihydrodipicolinate synthase family protein [Roseibacillus sp.]